MKTKINIDTYPRKEIFTFFSRTAHPFYMVSFTQDVTELYHYTKAHQLSFYYALTYLCTKSMNSIEAFRYTIKDGDLYLIDERIPSFTDRKKDSELFYIVTSELKDTMEAFCQYAKQVSSTQNCFLPSDDNDEVIYISCLPWLETTAITNEGNLEPDDAIPRISWGKYVEKDGRLQLNISIEVNHRFIDGIHIGQFHERLSTSIKQLAIDTTQK